MFRKQRKKISEKYLRLDTISGCRKALHTYHTSVFGCAVQWDVHHTQFTQVFVKSGLDQQLLVIHHTLFWSVEGGMKLGMKLERDSYILDVPYSAAINASQAGYVHLAHTPGPNSCSHMHTHAQGENSAAQGNIPCRVLDQLKDLS